MKTATLQTIMIKRQNRISDLQTQVNYTKSKRKVAKLQKEILKLAQSHNGMGGTEQYIILDGIVCGTITLSVAI